MEEKCSYHPYKKALSICHSCRRHFCEDCLIEGPRYYYCKDLPCRKKYEQEIDYQENPRFCPKCISETIDESAGDMLLVNLMWGEKLERTHLEIGDCDICGSIIMVKKKVTMGLEKNKGYYRVIWLNKEKTKLISRRIKNDFTTKTIKF